MAEQEDEMPVCAMHGLRFVIFAGGPVCPHDLPGYKPEEDNKDVKEPQVGLGDIGVE